MVLLKSKEPDTIPILALVTNKLTKVTFSIFFRSGVVGQGRLGSSDRGHRRGYLIRTRPPIISSLTDPVRERCPERCVRACCDLPLWCRLSLAPRLRLLRARAADVRCSSSSSVVLFCCPRSSVFRRVGGCCTCKGGRRCGASKGSKI